MNITVANLEDAINTCRAANPPVDCVLPTDLRLMASIYGAAIHQRADTVDLEGYPAALADAVVRWLPVAPACPLRSGSLDEPCDACQ